jgi:ATP-dependent Zn protease
MRERDRLQRNFIFRAKLPFEPVERGEIYGADHIFPQVEKIIGYLNNFEEYHKRGILFDGGAIFWGPPGCGKTFFARYVATKSRAKFVNVKEFPVELKSGVHAWQTRDVSNLFRFSEAWVRNNRRPIVLFIDQFDDWLKIHGKAVGADLEVELNGMFGHREGVFFIATSKSSPSSFGDSIFRPGRIGIHVAFSLPDHKQQVQLLNGFLKSYPHEKNIDVENLVYLLEEPTPISLKLSVEDAAAAAIFEGRFKMRSGTEAKDAPFIKEKHLLEVFLKKAIGSTTGYSVSDKDKLRIVVHELGHYIVGRSWGLPVRFVSIWPEIKSLGMTFSSGDPARLVSVKELKLHMARSSGGVEAEMICGLGEIASAASDIEISSEQAETLVAMSGHCRRFFLGEYGLLNVSRDGESPLRVSGEYLSKYEKALGRLSNAERLRARSTLKFFGKKFIMGVAEKIATKPLGVILQRELDKLLEPKLSAFHRLHKVEDMIIER